MTINYVPDNATSTPTRRQWEGETALGGGTVGPRREPRTLNELVNQQDALARQAAAESRHAMGAIPWLLASVLATGLCLVVAAVLWWPAK